MTETRTDQKFSQADAASAAPAPSPGEASTPAPAAAPEPAAEQTAQTDGDPREQAALAAVEQAAAAAAMARQALEEAADPGPDVEDLLGESPVAQAAPSAGPSAAAGLFKDAIVRLLLDSRRRLEEATFEANRQAGSLEEQWDNFVQLRGAVAGLQDAFEADMREAFGAVPDHDAPYM